MSNMHKVNECFSDRVDDPCILPYEFVHFVLKQAQPERLPRLPGQANSLQSTLARYQN
jgi:hypothetical protein